MASGLVSVLSAGLNLVGLGIVLGPTETIHTIWWLLGAAEQVGPEPRDLPERGMNLL